MVAVGPKHELKCCLCDANGGTQVEHDLVAKGWTHIRMFFNEGYGTMTRACLDVCPKCAKSIATRRTAYSSTKDAVESTVNVRTTIELRRLQEIGTGERDWTGHYVEGGMCGIAHAVHSQCERVVA